MYYVVTPMQGQTDAAEIKPKIDTTGYLRAIGVQPLRFSRFVKQDRFWRDEIIGMLTAVKANDTVILQLPTYAGDDVESHILALLLQNKVRVVALLHDVDYLRFPQSHPQKPAIDYLNQFAAVMVSTAIERQRLVADGIQAPITVIGPWGYQQTTDYVRPNYTRMVHYAGNLTALRSGFLAHVPAEMDLQAYGSNDGQPDLDFVVASNVHLHGVYSQFQLGTAISNGFGLVWDGNLAGQFSEYGLVNMPHKLSLYLAQGIPVLAKSGTASGTFVKKNHLGFVGDSLADLEAQLQQVGQKQYDELVTRIALVAPLIRNGYTVQRAALSAFADAASMSLAD